MELIASGHTMNIGYARVSTDDQNLALQRDALNAAGCEKVFNDHGISGTIRARSGLDATLAALNAGDTLVVWKLDRLGRGVVNSHDKPDKTTGGQVP
ncbi:hypothetical protein CCP3SC15_2100005 [Gammaproteobacteria bacterium]